jgi:S-adenosylmethionine-diacylglycerol 3-amino-3-carboxypropyl transferase
MVASGGCTAALLATLPNVSRLHLVDPNPAQIALARLKLRLIERASTQERMAVLGHAPMAAEQRGARLERELESLDVPPTALGAMEIVAEVGPDHAGRYERVFAELRKKLSHHADELKSLLRLRNTVEQSRRVESTAPLGEAIDQAFDEALSQANLVRLFGEAATQNRVEPFSRHFARRTRHALATFPAADNPYLWQVLMGRFPEGALSPWLAVPSPGRMPSVTFETAFMADALRNARHEYDFVHLSNILDWLDPQQARETLNLAWDALRPGGRVLIRQLNSTLDIKALGEQFVWEAEDAEALHARDRSYFYRALHLGRKR